MFTNVYPNFEKGRILKRDMLDSLRDYPRRFVDLLFQDRTCGIIAGADIRVEPEQLVVSSGIVKHQGRIYMLEEEQRIAYQATGRDTLLKIRFLEAEERSDFTVYRSEIVLEDSVQVRPSELELGRFKLKEGARLRSAYQSLADFATEYNTWNIVHVPYAGVGAAALHPAITRYFAAGLLSSGSQNPYDIAFAMQCLNQPIVERELLLHYLAGRLGGSFKPDDNTRIHLALSRILDDAQTGGHRTKSDLRPGGPRRMIVD